MCEFCTSHGEGKKWYQNIRNYTEEVFHQVNSEKHIRDYLSNFCYSLKVNVETAYRWKRRLPRLYNFLAYPLVTRRLKKTHFGQIIPIEDAKNLLNNFSSVVRLPCICRRVTISREKRFCLGIGMDLTSIFRELPDFRNFDTLAVKEAQDYLSHLDAEGNTHSVWTFNTPFIAALCNCDRDCMAYRFQVKMEIGKVMWKAEYVAAINPLLCNGCTECMKRCYFGGIRYNRSDDKCSVNLKNCYGCGICRVVCKNNAISLLDRSTVSEAAHEW